jgi:hypothetical protein
MQTLLSENKIKLKSLFGARVSRTLFSRVFKDSEFDEKAPESVCAQMERVSETQATHRENNAGTAQNKMLHFAAAVQVWYITGIKEEESFQANKYCNREKNQNGGYY